MIFSCRTPLNMTFGGSFSPFAFTVRATMKLCLSAPHDNTGIACVASAKRGGGREKGKRKGSACSKSLCFCITPTNFLVIRLRLLSIKCRYTRHCRKTLHSRTKEIRLVIQIQKALWRKLEPLFSRNKKALRFKRGQRNCACIRGQILPTRKQ